MPIGHDKATRARVEHRSASSLQVRSAGGADGEVICSAQLAPTPLSKSVLKPNETSRLSAH
jgi:hypothetical protein